MQIFSALIYLGVCYIFVFIKLICEQMKLKYVAVENSDELNVFLYYISTSVLV